MIPGKKSDKSFLSQSLKDAIFRYKNRCIINVGLSSNNLFKISDHIIRLTELNLIKTINLFRLPPFEWHTYNLDIFFDFFLTVSLLTVNVYDFFWIGCEVSLLMFLIRTFSEFLIHWLRHSALLFCDGNAPQILFM